MPGLMGSFNSSHHGKQSPKLLSKKSLLQAWAKGVYTMSMRTLSQVGLCTPVRCIHVRMWSDTERVVLIGPISLKVAFYLLENCSNLSKCSVV